MIAPATSRSLATSSQIGRGPRANTVNNINSGDVRLQGLNLINGSNAIRAAGVLIASTAHVTMSQVNVRYSLGNSLYVAGSLVFDGGTVQNGGPIQVVNGGTAVIRNATIADNHNSGPGGGLRIEGGATVSVTDSQIRNNISGGIEGGSSGNGGGIAVLGGQLTLNSVTLSGNHASSRGGGLFNDGATARTQMTHVAILNNIAGDGDQGNDGGGVYNGPSAQLTEVDTEKNTLTIRNLTHFSLWGMGVAADKPTAVTLRSLSPEGIGGLGQFAAWLAALALGGLALYRRLLSRR